MTKIKKSKKHRGIRDPLKLIEAKHQLIKDKVNNPPKNSNDQEISKFRRNLVDAKSQVKIVKHRQKKPRSKKDLIDTARFVSTNVGEYPQNGRLFKPVPTLTQRPNESGYTFFARVRKATEIVKQESQFQDKYKVEVQRDEFGQVAGYAKRPEYLSKRQHEANMARQEKKKLKNKEHALKKKIKKMKNRKRNNSTSSDDSRNDDVNNEEDSLPMRKKLFIKENIKFGEVVHSPPTIDTSVIEKKVKEEKNLQIKNFLFLQTLKNRSSETTVKEESSKLKKTILEAERKKAVFAYRQLKANKHNCR